jgi:hypothetical protein
MRRQVYDVTGTNLIRIDEEADPECGVDFCDDCGDCLSCYEGDDCGGVEGRCHAWVVYEEEPKYSKCHLECGL